MPSHPALIHSALHRFAVSLAILVPLASPILPRPRAFAGPAALPSATPQTPAPPNQPEPPPLPGYRRSNDEITLECIAGYWHEVTYAFYFSNSATPNTIFIRISDKDTGERCFVTPTPPTEPPQSGATRVQTLQ